MRSIVRCITALAASCLALQTLGAQSARLSVLPAHPAPGALVRVVLAAPPARGDSVVAVSGTLAREPLHFTLAGNGS